MFRQGVYEVFFETWKRLKIILRKCPNHGFEDIAQLSIFLTGLKFDTKILLDVAVGGTMATLDVEQATRIIDALASTNYKDQRDRQCIQQRGIFEDALLAQNKILTQQIEQLTAQITNSPQQLYIVHSSQRQSQSIRCNFCGGDHPNGHCSYEYHSPKAEDPSMLERMSKVEDTLTKLVIMEENSMTTIRNIEIQMGKVAKQFEEIQSGQFSVDSQTNPKVHCNNVVAEIRKEVRKKKLKIRRRVFLKKIYHILMLLQKKRRRYFF